MKRLIYMVRGLCWLFWAILYIVLAAWVGEGAFQETSTRFTAAFLGALWGFIGIGVIELVGMPEAIANALLEEGE